MQTTLPRRVRISDEVLFQEIEGEGVLLNLSNEQYFGLNEIGTRIWHLLSEDVETAKTFDALIKEYNVNQATLKNDLSILIEELNNQGLVIIED